MEAVCCLSENPKQVAYLRQKDYPSVTDDHRNDGMKQVNE